MGQYLFSGMVQGHGTPLGPENNSGNTIQMHAGSKILALKTRNYPFVPYESDHVERLWFKLMAYPSGLGCSENNIQIHTWSKTIWHEQGIYHHMHCSFYL